VTKPTESAELVVLRKENVALKRRVSDLREENLEAYKKGQEDIKEKIRSILGFNP
jgi:cell division protein FtsB